MGHPQPSPEPGSLSLAKDAVHRLNGGGSTSEGKVDLRYSRARPAMGRVEHSSRAFTVP